MRTYGSLSITSRDAARAFDAVLDAQRPWAEPAGSSSAHELFAAPVSRGLP